MTEPMDFDLKLAIARIVTPQENTIGTAFVLTKDGLLATCAHVVSDAGSKPGDIIHLAFHTDEKITDLNDGESRCRSASYSVGFYPKSCFQISGRKTIKV